MAEKCKNKKWKMDEEIGKMSISRKKKNSEVIVSDMI